MLQSRESIARLPAPAGRRPRRAKQLRLAGVSDEVERKPSHGGKRANAGRKLAPGKRPSLPHRARLRHTGRHPVHVTLRARAGLPSLRSQLVTSKLHGILARQGKRAYGAQFHVVEFSIQDNHVHLIVEAVGAEGAHGALRAGVSGLAIAFARRLNALLHRKGKVWGDRWHGRELATPREVRNALVYVFRNLARHGTRVIGEGLVDPFSSATTFDGWTRQVSPLLPIEPWAHPRPRTWLLGRGWRVHGLLDPHEARRMGVEPLESFDERVSPGRRCHARLRDAAGRVTLVGAGRLGDTSARCPRGPVTSS